MRIVKINGGLGNQMFQLAFALALDERHGDVMLDPWSMERHPAHTGYELERLFHVRLPVCSLEDRDRLGDVGEDPLSRARRRLRLTKASHYRQGPVGFDARAAELEGDRYYAGYWQSWRYFEGIEDKVRDSLRFGSPPSPRNADLLRSAEGRTAIGVHVRRGDYLASAQLAGVCDAAYYRRALDAALCGAPLPLVLFFSDDLDWCREQLFVQAESIFVDWNRGGDSFEDMRLMSRCDRLIIANSSFSWWSAWLGDRPDRSIFAPGRWFARGSSDNMDIVPPAWTRLGD